MVAAVSTTTSTATPKPKVLSRGPVPAPVKPKRAPLLPSEANNGGAPRPPPPQPEPRRPKSRDVTSRYLSSTSSSTSTATTSSSSSSSASSSLCTPRRFPSPMVSRTYPMTPTPSVNKRSQSAERRRPGTPRTGEMSTSAKMLMTSSRSLSVSFQGDSFALPISSKPKPAPAASNSNRLRNGTPERRKAVGTATTPARKSENSKPVDHQKWPGRSRQGNFLSSSVDFTNEKMKVSGFGTGKAVRTLQTSMIDENKLKPNRRGIPELDTIVSRVVSDSDGSDLAVSDTESVSSGSTPGIGRGGPRAIMVPARFWQETVNRLRRVQPEPVSPPVSKNNKLISGNRSLNDGPVISPRGSSSSPLRGAVRPASPSKRIISSSTSSPSRGIRSPSRVRNGVVGSNSNLSNTPSILSFAAEARRGKVGEDKLVDAHVLRLLYNKHLQWRFANATADAAMLIQSAAAQKSLYNAWVTTSKMWLSVVSKRIEIQQLRQNLKLHSVLRKQMPYLNNWDQTDRDHSISLSGAIVALESSTLRLPVVSGAKADVQNLKDAISSAVDIMQAMASSICSLLAKVEHVNSLASELATTTTNECYLLDQCKDLLSTCQFMQMQDCSLRTHVLQLQHIPSGMRTEL